MASTKRPPSDPPGARRRRPPTVINLEATEVPPPSSDATPAADDRTTRLLGALQRLLDPSPFKFFPGVDDFARQWQISGGAASAPIRSVATVG